MSLTAWGEVGQHSSPCIMVPTHYVQPLPLPIAFIPAVCSFPLWFVPPIAPASCHPLCVTSYHLLQQQDQACEPVPSYSNLQSIV